jgi:hypothetical protein
MNDSEETVVTEKSSTFLSQTEQQCKNKISLKNEALQTCKSRFSPTVLFFLVFRLLSRGYTITDIVNTVLQIESIKQLRRSSMKKGNWEKLNSAMDSAGRTLRNIVVGRNNDPKPNTLQARSA